MILTSGTLLYDIDLTGSKCQGDTLLDGLQARLQAVLDLGEAEAVRRFGQLRLKEQAATLAALSTLLDLT